MSGIHLFVPMLHRRDAVGEHTLALRDRLVASGVRSTIYSEIPDPDTADLTRHYLAYEVEAEAGDVLVYQFATESVMAGWLAGRPEPVVVNYHSITPPTYFGPWNNGITRLQVGAQLELALLAPRASLGIAVSRFDERELLAAGCPSTMVIPVANVSVPPVEPDPVVLEQLSARRQGHGQAQGHGQVQGHRWLSVGRLAPNKCHHQTIAALFVARSSTDPAAHLTLVGAPSEPSYAAALKGYAASLGLDDSVEFVTGISDAALAAHYRSADVLVMLSEHEGFGVPLVEAMGHGLPVVAFDTGAVGEVLDGAGVLLEDKGPRQVAAAVNRLLDDPGERDRRVAAGKSRFGALGLETAGDRLVGAVRGVSGRVGAIG
jgi:glycosyltransferase involved in cell wall biosynthesis